MQNLETATLSMLKKSFEWLDSDKDQQISIKDLETSCGISQDDAKSIYESLSINNESFITFQQFCEGVLSFPSLIDQFKQDQNRAERFSINNFSPLTQICNFFDIPSQAAEEDLIEQVSDKMLKISEFSKSKLISICECFFTSFLSLREFNRNLQEQQSFFNLEHSLQQDNLLREKLRCEKNNEELMEENKRLERENMELGQKILNFLDEVREEKLKVCKFKSEVKVLNRNIEELKVLIKSKEKMIFELNKKLQVKKAQDNIETAQKLSMEVKNKGVKEKKVSKTPRGTKFNNCELNENESAKDQIILNLKCQLAKQQSISKNYELNIAYYKNEYISLKEQIKILSSQHIKQSEDEEEEEFHFETLESLKEEVFYIDPDFFQTARTSLHKIRGSKEMGVQVEMSLVRKKSRYSCFSFFS